MQNKEIYTENQDHRKAGVKSLVTAAVFTALVVLATMVIQIPMPLTEGFINIGDTMIFVGAALFGGRFGLLIGGLGSALADLLSGYGHWAPWTLVIKGLEGLFAGILVYPIVRDSFKPARVLLGLALAGVWMVVGYFLASWIIYGSAAVAASSILGNILQAAASLVLSIPLIQVLKGRVR